MERKFHSWYYINILVSIYLSFDFGDASGSWFGASWTEEGSFGFIFSVWNTENMNPKEPSSVHEAPNHDPDASPKSNYKYIDTRIFM